MSRSNICVQLSAPAEPSHQQLRSSFWSLGTVRDDERQLWGEIAVVPHPGLDFGCTLGWEQLLAPHDRWWSLYLARRLPLSGSLPAPARSRDQRRGSCVASSASGRSDVCWLMPCLAVVVQRWLGWVVLGTSLEIHLLLWCEVRWRFASSPPPWPGGQRERERQAPPRGTTDVFAAWSELP